MQIKFLPYLAVILISSTSSANQNASNRSRVDILVLLPFDDFYLFSKNKIEPAIDYAMTSLRRNMPSQLKGMEFKFTYKNTSCDFLAGVQAVDFYYGTCTIDDVTHKPVMTSPMLLLGPVCNKPAAMVATFASEWGVPVLSPGSQAAWVREGDFPTLTQITPSYVDIAYFVKGMFKRWGHGLLHPVYLMYQEEFFGRSTENECHQLMQAVFAVFNIEVQLDTRGPYTLKPNTDNIAFLQKLRQPKAMLICASSDVVRSLMISAFKSGLTARGRDEWYAIDLHNDSHYAHGAWRRGDHLDYEAKMAYRALQIFTLRVPDSKEFINFSKYLKDEYRKRGIPAEDRKVNGYAENFHDAVLLYAQALNQTAAKGESLLDGKAISKRMRNITFQGIAGPVSLDIEGTRHGDYSLLAMTDLKTGKFGKKFDFFGNIKTIVYPTIQEENSAYDWINKLTRNYRPKKPEIRETGEYKILTAVVATLAGLVMCCLLIVAPICYRQKCSGSRRNSAPYLNNNQHEAVHLPLREEGSVATCMTNLDDDMRC